MAEVSGVYDEDELVPWGSSTALLFSFGFIQPRFSLRIVHVLHDAILCESMNLAVPPGLVMLRAHGPLEHLGAVVFRFELVVLQYERALRRRRCENGGPGEYGFGVSTREGPGEYPHASRWGEYPVRPLGPVSTPALSAGVSTR